MMRSTAKQHLTEATQNVIFKLVDNADVCFKLSTSEDHMSAEEDARALLLVRAMLRGFKAQCYQYEAGLLEDDEWKELRAAIVGVCTLPGVTKHWEQLKPYMSERLRKVVEGSDDRNA